jgi:hypothetical protein
MLGQGIFGGRDHALPMEVAVHITQDDSGALVGVVVAPGTRTAPAEDGVLPTGAGLVCRPAALAINDGIRKSQLLQVPLVIVDPYGVWDSGWGELRSH